MVVVAVSQPLPEYPEMHFATRSWDLWKANLYWKYRFRCSCAYSSACFSENQDGLRLGVPEYVPKLLQIERTGG
jgi:hypothetical protein